MLHHASCNKTKRLCELRRKYVFVLITNITVVNSSAFVYRLFHAAVEILCNHWNKFLYFN